MPTKNVKMPDGRVVAFPDSMSDDQISAAIQKDATAGQAQHQMKAEPSFFSKEGLKQAFYNGADHLTNALPAIAGIGGGMAGATLGPIGAVAGAGAGGETGEAARQLSRRAIFGEGPETSLEAASQIAGEGDKQALYETGGQAFGRIGKAIAPKIAEAAVAPGKRLLKSMPEGAQPIGETILKETKGYKPETIANELGAKVDSTSKAMDVSLENAGQRGVRVPLKPPRTVVNAAKADALEKNVPAYIEDVNKLGDQLNVEMGANGKPLMQPGGTKMGAGFKPVPVPAGSPGPVQIPDLVEPIRARQLRQGVDMTINGWNPESQSAGGALRERVHGAFSGAIHKAVPEVAEMDRRMTNLIPAKDAAWNTSFNPGITKNVIEKFARPTGALIGSIAGAKTGYDKGGVGGAIAGGTAGLLIPAAATSPTGLMFGARAANSALLNRSIRYTLPVIEGQMGRSKNKRPEDEAE
jgi:hypothetical protein